MSTIKVTFLKKDIENALRVAAIGVEGGDESKQGAHIVFRSMDGVLSLLSSGSRVFASVNPATVFLSPGDWSFTVPASRLQKLVSVLSDENAEIVCEHSGGVTTATTSRGKGRWGSLDATLFPYWDKTLQACNLTATVKSKELLTALDYSKKFVSDQDTKNPNLCAVECRDGLLNSIDGVALSLVEVSALAKATLRINGKDISSVNAFLGQFADEDVEVLEHDKCQIFRHGNALVGITRWMYPFPQFKPKRDDKDKCSFSIKAKDLREAITISDAFATKDDGVLHLSFDDHVNVSVKSASGASDLDTIPVTPIQMVDMEDFNKEFDEFKITREHVDRLLSVYGPEDEFKVGLFWEKGRGMIRVRRDVDGINYFTVVQWSK